MGVMRWRGGTNVRRLALAGSILAAGSLLAACSSDDKAPVPIAVVLTQAGDGALSLSAPDTTKSGAVKISFKNDGQGPASAEVIGFEGTHTVDEVLEVLGGDEGGPIPTWLKAAGGVGSTAPGQTSTATIELVEGSYYVIGQAESEDESEGPRPASATLQVSGDGGAKLPSAGTTIVTTDYAFKVDGDLKAGANTVRFDNDGNQIHHIQAFPITPGSSFDDAKAFFLTEGEPAGPPPLDFEGAVGTAALDAGAALVTTMDLKAGPYAFVCFIQDRQGGPPHFTKGMIQEVTVGS